MLGRTSLTGEGGIMVSLGGGYVEIAHGHMKPHLLTGIPLSRNHQPGHGSIPARPQLDLDGFVCACVIVKNMFELYERCSVGGRSRISRDEFLRAVISLP